MRGQGGDAELHERRRAQCGHNDVCRSRGHAHAEYETGEHQQDKQKQDIETAQIGDEADELVSYAGNGNHGDDDAGTGAACGDHQGIARRTFQRLQQLAPVEAGGFAEAGNNEYRERAQIGGRNDAAPGKQKPDENEDGQNVIQTAVHAARLRNLIRGHDADIFFDGLKVYHQQQGKVIQNGGQKRRRGHGHVARPGHIGHDESRCPHHRRHELPSRGGNRLNRARKRGRIAYALHKRDGERSRTVYVGDGGAGNRPEQRGGKNGDFGGAALGTACGHACQIEKNLPQPGILEKAAEHDKGEYHGR